MNLQYISDANGTKSFVVIPIAEFEKMQEELDMMEDIRLYDQAKAANEPSIPLDDAFKLIEEERKKNDL